MFYLILLLNLVGPLCWSQGATAYSNSDMFIQGEAYYLNNDLFEAEKIFKDIIKNSNYDEVSFKSMSRLVDIAGSIGDKKLFKDILQGFKNDQNVSSESYSSLLYNVGKYSFHEGNCDLAIKFLDKVGASTPYYSKAIYIKAACYALNGKYKDSLLYFDKLTKSKDPYITKDLKDLAVMGKARILTVLGRFKEAIAVYQLIDSISPYYLRSLYETGMLFLSKKDYDNALYHLEALSLLDEGQWKVGKPSVDYSDDITEFSLMKVKTMRGYIYMEQKRFDDADKIFEDVIQEYGKIKKSFYDELNKFKLSDDLAKLLSHPYGDGAPRDVDTNMEYSLFNNDQPYAKAFREWLSIKEKNELERFLNTYFSLNKRVESLLTAKPKVEFTRQELQLVAERNLMNRYLKNYIGMMVKVINGRLDDIGLKAQLGKIDITWGIKEDQSKKIKEIQESKQKLIEGIDVKYKGYTE